MSFVGVILLGETDNPSVLGTVVRTRLVLALQRAGATEVRVMPRVNGPEGALWCKVLSSNFVFETRSTTMVKQAREWPAGGALIVRDDVLLDARMMKTLVQSGDGTSLRLQDEAMALFTHEAGNAETSLMGTKPYLAEGGVAVRCVREQDVRVAERVLLDSLRKAQDGWISKALNRRISLAISSVLAKTNLHPNVLSVGILGVGLAGSWLASQGDAASLAWGGVLFQMQSILDGCDGEIARLSFRGSHLGEWLDTIGDDVTNYSFFAAAGLGLSRGVVGDLAWWTALAGVSIGMIASAIEYRYLIKIGSGDLLKYPLGFGNDPDPKSPTSFVGSVLGALRPAFKRDFFVFATMLAAMAGPWPMYGMLAAFAGGAAATLSAVVASEIRRAREG